MSGQELFTLFVVLPAVIFACFLASMFLLLFTTWLFSRDRQGLMHKIAAFVSSRRWLWMIFMWLTWFILTDEERDAVKEKAGEVIRK